MNWNIIEYDDYKQYLDFLDNIAKVYMKENGLKGMYGQNQLDLNEDGSIVVSKFRI